MTYQRHGLVRSRLDHARLHTDRSETDRSVQASQRHGPRKRVSGALSESRSSNDLPFDDVSALSAEIVGESHGIGLSVLWTVLCNHRRFPLTR
jgi:hypothetical protein